MKMMLSQYGKTVLYIIIALVIILPILFLSLRENMKDFTYDQNPIEYRDNSYLLEYEAPTITANKEVVKIAAGTNIETLNLKEVFGVKATINNGNTVIDDMYINYNAGFTTDKQGIYMVTFSCTYVYTTADGLSIPREGELTVKLLVE